MARNPFLEDEGVSAAGRRAGAPPSSPGALPDNPFLQDARPEEGAFAPTG